MDDLNLGEVASLFGSNIRRLREAKEWSQSELARRMKLAGWGKYSQMAVSRTEDGARTVRLDEAIVLADLLSSSIDDLLRSRDEFEETFAIVDSLHQEAMQVILSMNELGWQFGRIKSELLSACDKYLSLVGSKNTHDSIDEYRKDAAQRYKAMMQGGAYDAIAFAADRQMLPNAAYPQDGDYETLRGGLFDEVDTRDEERRNNGDD